MTTQILKNIYKIKTYLNAPKNQESENIKSLSYLESQLKKDNNLNEIYYGHDIIKIIIDVDKKGTNIDELNNDLEKYFFNNLHINIKYSYTENIKKFNEAGSFHIVITNICATVSNIKKLISDFNLNYPDYELDISIYKDGRNIVRLPNQTTQDIKGNIKHGHQIIKGELLDFYLLHTEHAINIDNNDYILKLQKEEKTENKKLNNKTTNNIFNKNISNDTIIKNKFDYKILESYITPNNKNEIIKLNLLNDKSLNSYYKWIQIGQLIYSLNLDNGAEIFEELSKKSPKYIQGEPTLKYKTFHKKKYTVGTLNYLCKQDNPEEFEKINNHLLYSDIFGEDKFLSTKMSQDYLIDNNDDKFILNHFDDFIKDNDKKTFCIKSTYNTGKTDLIKKLMTKYNPKKILMISYRISLTYDLKQSYKEHNIKTYLEKDYHADRLIVQIDSLETLIEHFERIDINIKYNWIIMDEIESLLNHFSAKTIENKSRTLYKYLIDLINIKGTKLLCMDGDFSNRSFNFINQFSGYTIIENTIKKNIKNFIITKNKVKYYNNIFNDINDDKKIVVVSMVAGDINEINEILKDKYPKKNIYIYTGLTGDDIKKEHFQNIEQYWKEADIILYSPTIESGVNFNIEHIDSIYGIFSDQSTSQRAFFQMLARTRQTKNNNIYILNPNLPEKTSANYYTFNEVLNYNKTIKSKFKEIDDEGNIKNIYSNYDYNNIYNEVETLNKNKVYFTAIFYNMAIKKGHSVIFDETNDEILKPENDKYLDINKTDLLINKINDSEDKDDIKNIIKKVKNKTATEQEKLQIEKYYFKQDFGFDIVNIEVLKKYYKKGYLVSNFKGLLSLENIYNIDEKDKKLAQIKIVESIFNDFTFDNIFDDKKLNAETFNNIKNYMIDNNIIFKDFNMVKSVFNMAKEPPGNRTKDNRAFLNYLNLLLKNYSVRISAKLQPGKRNEAKNMLYSIEILNDMTEIIQNLKEKGHDIKDTKNIFKPLKDDDKIYKHLYIKNEVGQKTEINRDYEYNDE